MEFLEDFQGPGRKRLFGGHFILQLRRRHGEKEFVNPAPQKKITIRDLAKELNLTPRSVSQALHPRESTVKLNAKTVERVQQLAREWNFRPDSRARSMRSGRFNNIGYFEAMPKTDSWPVLGAESGVYDYANEHQYRVGLIRLPSEFSQKQDAVPTVFREANVDALIISHAGNLSSELEKVIDASGFPVVYLNEKKKLNAVYVDDRKAARTLTHHILECGKKKIAYLDLAGNDRESHYSIRDRLKGYKEAMRDVGLEPKIIHATAAPAIYGAELASWFRAHSDVEAVIAYSDFTALQVFRAIRGSRYSVPENLLLAGFGDDFGKECSFVPLTTMKIPFYEMGRTAAAMAIKLVLDKQDSVPTKAFQAELVVRESTISA